MNFFNAHPSSIIRKKELAEFLGISVSQIYNLDLPDQVKLGPQARGYRLGDIEKWLDNNTISKSSSEEVAE
jgi:predicted DNA-binding transcriptional regulator AlpA